MTGDAAGGGKTATLNLRAFDAEDLQVLAATLQDAVIRAADMGYDRRARRFALFVNRFCWECAAADRGKRVRAALHFDGVLTAKCRNIDEADTLELLTVSFQPSGEPEDPGGSVFLLFAGDKALALEVECLEVVMRDQCDPWQARMRPRHFGVSAG